MTNIRRYFQPGDISFLTHVTHDRLPILIEHFDLIWDSVESANKSNPFELISWVALPDHFHLIIDPKENDLSGLMKRIKLSFSAKYRKKIGENTGRVWQNRFWDHIIRDENDLNRHIDYIHYNPVKHGIVSSPKEWKYSSIHKFIEEGVYSEEWGARQRIEIDGDFGE